MNLKEKMVELTTVDGTPIQQSIYEVSSTPYHNIGARATDLYGRVFRYCSNGTTELAANKMIQSSAALKTKANIAVTTGTGGTAGVNYLEASATGVTKDQYAGGFLNVITSNGTNLFEYGISANTSTAASTVTTGTGYVRFTLNRKLDAAITNGNDCDICPNPFKSVIVVPATPPSGLVIGVPLVTVTASTSSVTYYFWAQTWGIAPVYYAGGVGATGGSDAGGPLIINSTIAGTVSSPVSIVAGHVLMCQRAVVAVNIGRTLVSVAPLTGPRQVCLTCIP